MAYPKKYVPSSLKKKDRKKQLRQLKQNLDARV